MPPVAAAAAAIGGAFTAAATTAAGTAFGGVFLTAGAGGVGMTIAGKLLAGVALSAMSRALAPKPKTPSAGGMKVSMTFGEDQPQSFILGKYTTPGDLVYHNAWENGGGDTPNEYYVQVIELADLPADLSRVWINGEWVTLKASADFPHSTASPGVGVEGYEVDGEDRLLVKFYDGTQTAADPYLLEKFGSDPDRPWLSDMIGLGIPYLIVTAGQRKQVHKKKPEVKAELIGRHYDRRRDSSAGGTGAHRWDDWTTWRASNNPIVLLDNVLRGVRDPITGEHLWGGQDIGNSQLPASVWFAAMNECDQDVAIASGGNEPQYRAGLEVRVSEEPATIAEELLKACQGLIAQVAGEWHVRAGPPGLPVYSFTDDDIIVTSPEDFEPFPGVDEAYNAVMARYPEPEDGWAVKDAPERASAAFLDQDLGRRNVAELVFPAVPYRRQVQRLMLSALRDSRRFRRHLFSLPPEARALTPLDEVSWTSARRGYEDKDWSIATLAIGSNGLTRLGLQERDPTDYDWNAVDELPTTVGWKPRPGRKTHVADFSVEPASIPSDTGPRRPAIRLLWTVRSGVTGIGYRCRLASSGVAIPLNGVANRPDGGLDIDNLTLDGDPATIDGSPVTFTIITDASDGEELLYGGALAKNTTYEVQAIYLPITGSREWSDWLSVTTPNIGIPESDLDTTIIDKITDARDDANDAALLAQQAQADALAALDAVEGLSDTALAQLQAIADQLAGLEAGTIQEIMGIAVAGLRRGWAKDPTFNYWEGGLPTKWSGASLTTASRVTTGFYPSAVRFVSAGTTSAVNINASTLVAGQLDGVNLAATHVVVSALLRIFGGSIATSALRVDWRKDGVWHPGHAMGVDNATGTFSLWGFTVAPTQLQSREVVWKRPVSGADAMRVILIVRATGGAATGYDMQIDYLDVRGANDAEIKGYESQAYANAAISSFEATLIGPGGALAAVRDSIVADFGLTRAGVNLSLVAVANETEAMSGRLETLEAQYGGNNLVKNGTFSDGERPVGETPDFWQSWPVDWRVMQRGTLAGSPVMTAPTRFVGRMSGTAVSQQALAHNPVPVKPGDRIGGSIRMAMASAGAREAGLRFRWFDADGNSMASTYRTVTLTTSNWVGIDLDSDPVIAPANAAAFDTAVWQGTGSLLPIYFTSVEVAKVDGVSFAKATLATTTAANADAAVATWRNKVEARFGDYDSFLTETGSAIATADKAASAYVVRAVAGSGSAGLRIVAWDNETNAGGAVFLDGNYVFVPGTLAAGSIVVTDLGYNMVPDNQIQGTNDWSGGTQGFTVIKNSTNDEADSVGELRFFYSNPGALPAQSFSPEFPVRPSQRLRARYQAQRLSGTNMVARARIAWYGKDGTYTGVQTTIGNINTTSSALQTVDLNISVPETTPKARRARFVFEVLAGTDGNLRFFSPSVISNEDASVLITPDGIFADQLVTNHLTTRLAWIKTAMISDAQMTTAKIGPNAVTVSADARTPGSVVVGTTETTVQTLSIVSGENETRRGIFAVTPDTSGFATNGLYEVALQRSRDGGAWSDLERIGGLVASNSALAGFQPVVYPFSDQAVPAGTYSYRLRVKASDASGVPGWGASVRLRARVIQLDMFKR